MSCTPWGQVANELDWIFRFCKISIGPGTWNLKKKLNTRSNLIPPFKLPVKKKLILHSGIYGHKNETLILQNFAFIMQFYTYSNPYDMN